MWSMFREQTVVQFYGLPGLHGLWSVRSLEDCCNNTCMELAVPYWLGIHLLGELGLNWELKLPWKQVAPLIFV